MVKRLSPGERAQNWATALVTLWPVIVALIGLLGYTNRDHIRNMLTEADGKTEIDATGPTFEAQVKKFSEEVRAELIRIEQNSAAIRRQMENSDRETLESLQAQIDALKKWHE
jgi:hypothetical protein